MSEAQDIINGALEISDRRYRDSKPTDYDALNRMVKRQRAALTRAKNSGDPDKVIIACRDAVREWDGPGVIWPDDWSTWQGALDDVLPWNRQVDLRDLA